MAHNNKVNKVKLILCDTNGKMCDAFKEQFANDPDVTVTNRSFTEVEYFDAIVSPANSFGLMDGGIDWFITDYFGKQLMTRVQEKIICDYLGEQPVGSAFVIETGNEMHPYLVHSPTMRVPKSVKGTDIAYVSTHAALIAVNRHNRENKNKIEILLMCGMGTGCGEMDYNIAASQMARAWKNQRYITDKITWSYAQRREEEIKI